MIMLRNRGYHDLRFDESGRIRHGDTCCGITVEREVGLLVELEATELCISERNL
jgi:hypothetical protein